MPTSLDTAVAWIEMAVRRLGQEDVPLRASVGRVLVDDVRAERPIPVRDSAALDGFAVQAHETIGASTYNPLSLPLIELAAGDFPPQGTDAVVPLDHGEPDGSGRIILVEAVAPGDNTERQGAIAAAGALLIPAETLLAPRHIGICAIAGLTELPVVRRPQVRVVIAGTRRSGEESDGPMLCGLVERDGGTVSLHVAPDRSRSSLVEALAAGGTDIVLVVGGTGPGRDDESAAALSGNGKLAIHGAALHPGETAGLGHTAAGIPVVLLPGSPAACLWSYEILAGRAIRRLGGRDAELPYRSRVLTTSRKIVSAIGMTEICPVRRLTGDSVEPVASFAEIGLMAAVGADGFVIVPETSEGYPAGASVKVYLYDDR